MTYGRTFQADATAKVLWLKEPTAQENGEPFGETGAQGVAEDLGREKKNDWGGILPKSWHH